MLNKIIFAGVFILLSATCLAQDYNYPDHPEQLYNHSKNVVLSSDNKVSHDTIKVIAQKEYDIISNASATTLSWDGDFENARKQFNRLTSKEREDKEVWVAAINNEIYAEEYQIALGLAYKALHYLKDNVVLLALKDNIIKKLDKNNTTVAKHKIKDADMIRKELNRITSKDRTNKKAWVRAIKNEINEKEFYIALGLANKALLYLHDDADLLQLKTKAEEGILKKKTIYLPLDSTRLEKSTPKNRVVFSNTFETFDRVYQPMRYTSVSYQRETKLGKIIPRVNYYNRFQTNGFQYEMDLYPKISKFLYGYLNYGYSNAIIFPKHRAGLELYANLPKNLETSIGFRLLQFASRTIRIYTSSFGLYRGNYYYSLRPYITSTKRGGANLSGSFLFRKYLKNASNYFGFRAGMGFNPELRQLFDGENIIAESLLYIESQQLQFEYQFQGWSKSNNFNVNLGLKRQELIFDANTFVWSVSAGVSCSALF